MEDCTGVTTPVHVHKGHTEWLDGLYVAREPWILHMWVTWLVNNFFLYKVVKTVTDMVITPPPNPKLSDVPSVHLRLL